MIRRVLDTYRNWKAFRRARRASAERAAMRARLIASGGAIELDRRRKLTPLTKG